MINCHMKFICSSSMWLCLRQVYRSLEQQFLGVSNLGRHHLVLLTWRATPNTSSPQGTQDILPRHGQTCRDWRKTTSVLQDFLQITPAEMAYCGQFGRFENWGILKLNQTLTKKNMKIQSVNFRVVKVCIFGRKFFRSTCHLPTQKKCQPEK